MFSDYNSVKVTTFLLNNLPFVSKRHKKIQTSVFGVKFCPLAAAIHQSTHIAETLPTVEENVARTHNSSCSFPSAMSLGKQIGIISISRRKGLKLSSLTLNSQEERKGKKSSYEILVFACSRMPCVIDSFIN